MFHIYVLDCYLIILPKVTPSWVFVALFSNLEIMRDGPPRAISVECVAFLKLLHVFCIMANVYSTKYGWANLSNFQSLKN